jgi:hypothetical protein
MANGGDEDEIVHVPLSGTRAQSIQRLQIGLAGLGTMVLLVGLANIILDRVKQSDAASVPEAVAAATPTPTPMVNDPLADAGVAPEVPAVPKPTATPTPPPSDLNGLAPSGD